MSALPRIASAALAAAAASLVLASCGTTAVDEPTAQASDAAAAISDECAADTTATSTEPVSLVDGVGRTVELDEPAERIVVLEWQQIEDALTLCVAPVGVSDAEGFTTWDSAEVLPEGVADIGAREEPDLDAIYALDPDLIVVEAFSADDEIIAQLEEGGVPVLATLGADPEDPIGNMLSVFTMIGEATGRSERADVVVDEFETHLAEAKAEVEGADLPTTDFLFFDGWVDSGNLTIRPYTDGALFTELGKELGLTPAWDADIEADYGTGGVYPDYGLTSTDLEGLTAVGDANLFYANDDGAGSYVEEMEKNEIWTSLPAVQEGRVHKFPPRIWGAGGPRSCEQAIDAYVDAITGA
ncbi:iron-siderophore ABC transporter substrate-binding protein [Brachybacterium sp. DNPG3]